jgi:exopolysaccharide biosynthesis polyprenyl glycosylphosphotransferase
MLFRSSSLPRLSAYRHDDGVTRSAATPRTHWRRFWESAGESVRVGALDTLAVVVATSAGGSWATRLIIVGGALVALSAIGMYQPRLRLCALDEAPGTLLAVGAAWVVGGWIAPPAPAPALPAAALWWWLVVAASIVIARALGYSHLRRRRRTSGGDPAVIVGADSVGVRLAEILLSRPDFGLRPVGFADAMDRVDGVAGVNGVDGVDVAGNGHRRRGLPVPLLGPVDTLPHLVDQQRASHVLVAFPATMDAELVAALRICGEAGQTVLVVPRLFQMNVGCVKAESVQGIPIVRMPPPPTRRRTWRLKRVIDVIGAGLSLVLLSPLFLLCALAVGWEIGRDRVLFRQERISAHGKRFHMMKFRTLSPSSNAESETRWTIDGDPRVGAVGRLLRSTSLDELPQVLNVLRGDMSLVGPRPERPFFVEKFQSAHRHYMDRHRVPAGMTGWAQVHGLRGDTSIEQRAEFDNYYIENWSLGLDIKIMLLTVLALIRSPRS